MTQRTMASVNAFLEGLDGAFVSFNHYTTTHQRFTLAVQSRQAEPVALHFSPCLYVAGPTSWENARLRCVLALAEDGTACYEARDERVGFIARSASIVTEEVSFGTG